MALKDLFLVYARNIGKGFTKNTETKQYDVALGKGLKLDKAGNIYVDVKAAGGVDLADVNNAISKDKTNELSLKEDGLYVGQKANYPTAFVDVEYGEDGTFEDGFGTRAKPFKTLKHALKLGEYGKAYTIFLKERQEHLIDEHVNFACSKLTIGSYGAGIDACRNEYVDGFQHSVGIVRDKQLHAKIVFKGLEKYLYPLNTTEQYYVHRNYKLISSYAGFTTFNASGIGFIIDLGSYVLETTPHVGSNYLFKDKGCIAVEGSINFTNFTFSTRGTPTVPSTLTTHQGNLNEFIRDDLYSIGLIKVEGGRDTNVFLRNWFETSENPRAKCMILAETGWLAVIDTKTTLNFANQYDRNSLAEVAKRVGNIYKENVAGLPYVRLPVNDMNLQNIWNF